jgi:hypothetical protein
MVREKREWKIPGSWSKNHQSGRKPRPRQKLCLLLHAYSLLDRAKTLRGTSKQSKSHDSDNRLVLALM